MIKTSRPRPGDPFPRSLVITLLKTALSTGENRFARQMALSWVANYPGDLEARYLLARATVWEGRPSTAIPILEELCQIDPEYLDAQELLLGCQIASGGTSTVTTAACVKALGGHSDNIQSTSEWAGELLTARVALHNKELDRATNHAQRALSRDPDNPLPAIIHLKATHTRGEMTPKATCSLAQHYLGKWSKTLAFSLILADALMEGGEPEQAVSLIHQAAASDIAGQVPTRLWGVEHPYRSLWPEDISLVLDPPIPAAVGAILGWNQLPRSAGESLSRSGIETHQTVISAKQKSSDQVEHETALRRNDPGSDSPSADLPDDIHGTNLPETLRSVREELDRVAARLKKPHLANIDGRFPIYVVFSTRGGLEKEYGPETASRIDTLMNRLVDAIRERKNWGALQVYGDDPRSMTPFGIKPARAEDPWALKLVLADLDEALRKRGEMIGALLIVGGPDVVPFHHLPNPVDDDDVDVPSDNPYSTRDDNYFIPEWPVGRLPGGSDGEFEPLLKSLEGIIENHTIGSQVRPWYRLWLEHLINWFWPTQRYVRPSFGYTAAVWRKASLMVFRPIGEARTLLASPPSHADHLPWNGMTPAMLGYYNLHGLEDTPEWYGQRDPADLREGPDYPVALRPKDVVNSGRAPNMVFSEACFGGHVIGKSVEQALALKFLSAGTQAMVGSTSTSYGSIAPPLIAADLLGRAFWQRLKGGDPAGEALRWAKIQLAQEMDRRQGYLDGEDQKTLISFVLYGDPLAQTFTRKQSQKSVQRARQPHEGVKTVCDRVQESNIGDSVPEEILVQIKQVVEQYLPGMADARHQYSLEHSRCDGLNHECPTSQLATKSPVDREPDRRVVTLSKQVRKNAHVHPHFARLTLDARGKVIKLAVSR